MLFHVKIDIYFVKLTFPENHEQQAADKIPCYVFPMHYTQNDVHNDFEYIQCYDHKSH